MTDGLSPRSMVRAKHGQSKRAGIARRGPRRERGTAGRGVGGSPSRTTSRARRARLVSLDTRGGLALHGVPASPRQHEPSSLSLPVLCPWPRRPHDRGVRGQAQGDVMPAPFRTSLHGTCLLDGNHPPGSRYARECPVLRRQRKVQTPQDDAKSGSQGVHSGSPAPPPASPHQSGQIGQVDVTLHRGGRPRKHPDARTAHVAAQRAYRARQKAEG